MVIHLPYPVMSKADVRHEPLMASRFRFSGPRLLFARARLFAGRIELSGWHLRGRYRQEIALRQILQADVSGEGGLLLWLSDGKTLRLQVPDARRWKEMITNEQIGNAQKGGAP